MTVLILLDVEVCATYILHSHCCVNVVVSDLQRLTPNNLHICTLRWIKHSSGSAHRLTTARKHFFLVCPQSLRYACCVDSDENARQSKGILECVAAALYKDSSRQHKDMKK
jgi:hypothetical protein